MNLAIHVRHAVSVLHRDNARNCLIALVLLFAAMHPAGAQADESTQKSWPQVWLNPGIYSHHFDSDKGLRNNNIGFGAEVMLSDNHVLMAGSFVNSNRARTRFAGYQWRPLHWKVSGVDVGRVSPSVRLTVIRTIETAPGLSRLCPCCRSKAGTWVQISVSFPRSPTASTAPSRFRSSCACGELRSIPSLNAGKMHQFRRSAETRPHLFDCGWLRYSFGHELTRYGAQGHGRQPDRAATAVAIFCVTRVNLDKDRDPGIQPVVFFEV